MADSADTIKEFLVSLGFKIDAGGERRFVDSIGQMTVKAAALGTAMVATASAVVAGVAKIADNLEQLYFASQRTNASVENLQATGFAAKQMGSDAAAALGSVENLARFLRTSPGSEGLLKNIGVSTRDANGNMRDTVELLGDLGKKFASMPYYRANAYAQALGIDEKTLMAMRQGMGEFQNQYKDMLRAAGIDAQEAAKSSHEFMSELRLFGASFQILAQKVATSLTGPLGGGLRRLRESFVANFDWISGAIGAVMGIVGRVISAVAALTARVGQMVAWLANWFQSLGPEGKMLIGIIGGIAAAWRALNFLMALSPIGIVIALGTALLALWDDYQTWKEGGDSLIDWSAWAPGIEAALKGIEKVRQVLIDATEKLIEFGADLPKNIVALIDSAGDAARRLGEAIYKKFIGALDFSGGIRRKLAGIADVFASAAAPAPAAPAAPAARPPAAPASAIASAPAPASAVPASRMLAAPAPVVAPNPRDPRGIRNNNPGNINYGDFARARGATGIEAGPDGRFATFASAQAGLNALGELLRSKGYIGGGRDTVRAIITRYAPAKDNNDTEGYIRGLSKRLGVDSNTRLDPNNLQQMSGLIAGIVRIENGKNPYSREQIDRAAAARPPAITQSNTYNIHGNDAKEVARDVSKGQNNVNEQLIRNMRGAVLQ